MMDKCKLLSIALLLLFNVVLSNGSAFAERQCTHEVVNSGGTKTIITDCTSSKDVTSEDFWNRNLFTTLFTNLQDRINTQMQNLQDRLATLFSSQEQSKQHMDDMKEKIQDQRDAQMMQREQQQMQMDALRDRQAMQRDR